MSICDPVALYQDLAFTLDPARGVNNGSPSLHAHWLNAIAPHPGERVCHIGAGTGYYTAILAELVGPQGTVVAVEFDPRLTAAARANLSHCKNAAVVEGDGTTFPDVPADCIYVNFGVERPMTPWLEALPEGGRLIFPLGYRQENFIAGGGFLITRDNTGFSARFLGGLFYRSRGRIADDKTLPGPYARSLPRRSACTGSAAVLAKDEAAKRFMAFRR